MFLDRVIITGMFDGGRETNFSCQRYILLIRQYNYIISYVGAVINCKCNKKLIYRLLNVADYCRWLDIQEDDGCVERILYINNAPKSVKTKTPRVNREPSVVKSTEPKARRKLYSI